ncbi:GGDEF domain-containing protein [Nitrosophilus alvini]|uniref:GGDEF domain-containing protein n=1 Tax=Nitrosophilus alvini TaxID=2714855 RepID=UPI00190A1067|nr:GGDEF domain-containing protein [Nitrosophilus alvini]
MKVKDFMTKDPVTVNTKERAEKVIDMMGSKNIGSVIVVDKNFRAVDIITERDIIKMLVAGYIDMPIGKILKLFSDKKSLITIEENENILKTMKIFSQMGIKHLPVVDENRNLKGIISAGDIIRKVSPLAFFDPLTNVGNRNYLSSICMKIQKRDNIKYAVLFLDIDNFKRVNDQYGHQFGDKVLKKIAAVLVDNIRVTDEVIRYGGEEFLIILFRLELDKAEKIAEKLRKIIKKISFEEHPELKITVSIGVALCCTKKECIDLDNCIEKADIAVYEAKKQGKDRVVLWREKTGLKQNTA